MDVHVLTLTMKCTRCGERTQWHVEHRIFDKATVAHCFVCDECGQVVPDFALEGYLRTGTVVIGR